MSSSIEDSEFLGQARKESAQVFIPLTFPSGQKNSTFGQKSIT